MTFRELALEIHEERERNVLEGDDRQSKSELVKAGKRYIKSKLEVVFLSIPELDKEIIFNFDEIEDFIYIQEELERISLTVDTLRLWSERMLAQGIIDAKKYQEYKNTK